jgi:hypothetical protein
MPEAPAPVTAHDAEARRLALEALAAARAAWRKVSLVDVSGSWEEAVQPLLITMTQLQRTAARSGSAYTADALAAQGDYEAPAAFVNPGGFAGIAPDGRELAGLLYSPATKVKAYIGRDVEPVQALRMGRNHLDVIARTVVADTARAAASVDIASRPNVGYTRMLVPPSCGRCAVLAGRFYRWNQGFARHPRCFPAGTVVSGPSSEAASRRWYEGELVTLTTASGQELSLTGNHPVLTRRGWVPANLIEEGDEVLRSTRTEGATALVVPDHDQVPALIEDVWRAFSVRGLETVPTTAEHFHGDGQHGEVDIVHADSTLRDRLHSALAEQVRQQLLPGGVMAAGALLDQCAPEFLNLAGTAHPGGPVGRGGLELAFLGAHLRSAHGAGGAEVATGHTGVGESFGHRAAGDTVLGGQGVLARASLIGRHELLDGDIAGATRWDAPGDAFTLETRDGYAALGRDLLERLAGQVEPDRVIQLRRSEFRGHVFSLTSSEGWHTANSLIVSNCDCKHVPTREDAAGDLTTDPYEYFNSLDAAAQDKLFGQGAAQAIRDGADVYQVVNAQRGISYGGISADGTRRGQRRGGTTSEGTTRRGNYGRTRGPRLTPEAIYARAKDRDEALGLLERYGYVLPGGQQPGGVIRGDVEGYGQMGRGGTRVGARTAVQRARATGRRDPTVRATMTAAERRFLDAQLNWDAVSRGRNPFGRGRLTPELAASVENDYRRIVLDNDQAAQITARRSMAANR